MEHPQQAGFNYTLATIGLSAFAWASKGLSTVLLKFNINPEVIKDIQPYVSFISSLGAIVTTCFAIRYYIIASREKKKNQQVKYKSR